MRPGVDARLLILALLPAVLGCGPEWWGARGSAAGAADPGVRLVVLDSVLLRESDSLNIARFGAPVVDPRDGSLLVTDWQADRVYRFGRTGEPLQTYGRPGGGPGELRSASYVFPVNDSILAVFDGQERALELFDGRTTVSVGRRPDLGRVSSGGVVASARGDTMWLPFTDFPLGGFSVSLWVPGADDLQSLWPVPRAYRNHPHYFALGPWASLARWEDAFLLGFGALPNLYIVDLTSERGSYRDSLHVPVRRRRPIPGRERMVEIAETLSEAEKRSHYSTLLNITPRPDGSYFLVHADPHMEGAWPSATLRSDFYLSVLSADLQTACVDVPLNLPHDAQATFTFRGDTLFHLRERIVPIEADGEPGVDRWVVLLLVELDEERCEWLPTAVRGGVRGREAG